MTPAERVLARAADWGRAPSAHNTQPWDVRAAGPDTLELGWHADRVLQVGDPSRRDLFLSLGCVAEALAVVAAEEGYAVRPAWRVDQAARVAGSLGLSPGSGHRFSVAELRSRRTARAPYADPPIPAEQVADLAGRAGVGGRLRVLPRALVVRALPVADRWTFDGPTTGELVEWLRLGAAAANRSRDGLSADALQLSTWERTGLAVALAPIVLPVLRRTGATALLARSATARPLGTVVALTGPTGLAGEEVLDLGRRLLWVWLEAARSGLSAHPLSQLLDCPDTEPEVSASLGPGLSAYAVFRLGRPTTPPPRSHRLTD